MASPPQSNAGSPAREIALKALFVALGVVAIYFLVRHAFPKLVMTEAVYTEYYWGRRFWLLPHVIGGLAATLLGPVQFVPSVRKKAPATHRWVGRIYLAAVALSATTALYLAGTSSVSRMYTIGLIVVATLWLGSGFAGFNLARRRRFADHRRWMIRNYTITFFFILFFAVYDLFVAAGLGSVEQVATIGVWACWMIPLAVVEWRLRAGRTAAVR